MSTTCDREPVACGGRGAVLGTYTALIRTCNSEFTLPELLQSLARQTNPPSDYVVVDNGSSDQTTSLLPSDATVVTYDGTVFNFAAALNQGLEYVQTEFVLIISSHVRLENACALMYAVALLESEPDLAAAYFLGGPAGDLHYEVVHRGNFTGFNGLWNTAALIRMSLLNERMFREDVFSAEDQEWAAWVFRQKQGRIARIRGANRVNNNPRKRMLRKRLNEHIAIACYVMPEHRSVSYLANVAFRCVKPTGGLALRERLFSFVLFFMLLRCCVSTPKLRSRYF